MATDQEIQDIKRTNYRIIVTLPLVLIIISILLFIFSGKKIFPSIDNDSIGAKLILLGIISAIIFVSYLLTGLIIPKQTA